MTPEEYLNRIWQLSRARDMVGIMAFSDEHLTEEMFDAMTPQQRRDVHSAIHIAIRFVGEGPLDPPRGIPVDDDDDDLVDVANESSASPVRSG